jgi:glycosyltransferase involved in cell wall biosynthesis
MSLTVMQVLHQGGGAGSVLSTLHLSLGLARAGLQVAFVCPPDSEVEGQARQAGLEVHPMVLERGQRRANAARLAALLARRPVDLVNSQSARDREALTWLKLTGRHHVPLVVTRRQMPRTFPVENWLASRMAARVVAVSRPVAEALARRGTPRGKLVVIPNGLVEARVDVPVEASAVEAWRHRLGWEPGRRTVGIVSRLKDQPVVLRALERVQTPVRLALIGVGADELPRALIDRVPPRHAVVAAPFVSEVRPVYELLELALLPSRMEGLSQALLEAMALGKPVIASAAAGNLDLITDGADGRLVAPDDPAAWARAIDELLASGEVAARLRAAAQRTARERFALRRTVERTRDLYFAILGRPPLPAVPG